MAKRKIHPVCARFTGARALPALLTSLLICAMLLPGAAAEVVNLKINQIVQQDGAFTLYLSALDRDSAPSAFDYPAESYEVRADALAPVAPESAMSFSHSGEGVSYIVAVDVSGSVTKQEAKDIKQALHDFVSRLGSSDYVKLITIGSEIDVVLDYTSDRGALNAAIDSKIHRHDPKTYLYQGLIRAMDSAATQMIGGPRRSVMIVFTDGGDDSDGVWTADDVVRKMDTLRLPVYAVALKGSAKANPSAVNRLCEDTGGALYKEEDLGVAGALERIRAAVMNSVVLTLSPLDPAYFGVKESLWSVSLRAEGRMVLSSAYALTTSPTAPPARVELSFFDAGMGRAIRKALGRQDAEPLFEEDRAAIAGLTTLYADGLDISDLRDLSMMPGLGELALRDNDLTDVSQLKDFTSLTALSLDGNHLTDLSPLKYLGTLRQLSARDNRIADISFARTLDSLEGLDLSGNQIEDVSPLRSLTGLTVLNLSGNRIRAVAPLAGIAGLKNLDLTGNPVADAGSLRSIADRGGVLLMDVPLATPEPSPTPIPTPVPTPAPSAGQAALRWALGHWLYLVIAAVALLAAAVGLVLLRRRRDGGEDGLGRLRVKDVLPEYAQLEGDPDKTIPIDPFSAGDPDKTIPLGEVGVKKIRFVVEYAGRSRELVKPIREKLTIGRAADRDVTLEDDQHVSRKHAELTLKFDGLYLKDAGSYSGTFLNGAQIARETQVRKGSLIKLGETTLKIADITN